MLRPLMLALLLAGCVARPEDYAGPGDPYQAYSECRYEALKATAGSRSTGIYRLADRDQIVRACMDAKGFYRR